MKQNYSKIDFKFAASNSSKNNLNSPRNILSPSFSNEKSQDRSTMMFSNAVSSVDLSFLKKESKFSLNSESLAHQNDDFLNPLFETIQETDRNYETNYPYNDNFSVLREETVDVETYSEKLKKNIQKNTKNKIYSYNKVKSTNIRTDRKNIERMREEKLQEYDIRVKSYLEEGKIPSVKNHKLNLSANNDFQLRINTQSKFYKKSFSNETFRNNISYHMHYQDAHHADKIIDDKAIYRYEERHKEPKLKKVIRSYFGDKYPKKYNELKHRKLQVDIFKNRKFIEEDLNTCAGRMAPSPDYKLVCSSMDSGIPISNYLNMHKNKLDFSNCFRSRKDATKLATAIEYIQEITKYYGYYGYMLDHVDFTQNNFIEFADSFFKLIPRQCTHLNMADSKINLECVKNMFDYLFEYNQVLHLSLVNSSLSDLSINKLFNDYVWKCPNLVKLDISNNSLSSHSIHGIVNYLKYDYGLVYLRANDCTLNLWGLKDLLSALSSNYQLKILELKRNSFKEYKSNHELLEIRDQLYTFMLYNKTLYHLDIGENDISMPVMRMFKGIITPRHNFLYIHTNRNDMMFDYIEEISTNYVLKAKVHYNKVLTGCAACDGHVLFTFSVNNLTYDGFNEFSGDTYFLCLEYYGYEKIKITKIEKDQFTVSLLLPNLPQLFFIHNQENYYIHLNGFKVQKNIENENFKNLTNVDKRKCMILKPKEGEKGMKFNLEIQKPLKYKKPTIIKKKFEFNSNDFAVKCTNYFVKHYNYKQNMKNCAAFDVNNSNIFKFFTDNLKYDITVTKKALTNFLNKYHRYWIFYIYLASINPLDERPNYNIDFKIVEFYFKKINVLGKIIEENSFITVWNNVQGNSDTQTTTLKRHKLLEFIIRLFAYIIDYKKDKNSYMSKFLSFLNDITEYIADFDPIIFKNKIYDNINIENTLQMNLILYRTVFNIESNGTSHIRVSNLFHLFVQKMQIDIKYCEFHYHILSTLPLVENENHSDKNTKLDFTEFIEFFLRILDCHRDRLVSQMDYHIMRKWYRVRSAHIRAYVSRHLQDELTFPQLIMLYSHLFIRAIPESKEYSDVIMDSFGKFKTIRNYNDYFLDDTVSDDDDDKNMSEEDFQDNHKGPQKSKRISNTGFTDDDIKAFADAQNAVTNVNESKVKKRDSLTGYNTKVPIPDAIVENELKLEESKISKKVSKRESMKKIMENSKRLIANSSLDKKNLNSFVNKKVSEKISNRFSLSDNSKMKSNSQIMEEINEKKKLLLKQRRNDEDRTIDSILDFETINNKSLLPDHLKKRTIIFDQDYLNTILNNEQ